MNSFQKLAALLYLTTHAFMGTTGIEDEHIDLFIAYHILHPTGQGVDIQPLLYGESTSKCYERMNSHNEQILRRIVNVLLPELIQTELEMEDIRVFLQTKVVDLADEFREKIPQPSLNTVLAITPVLFENWQPTASQVELYKLVQNLLSQDDDNDSTSDDDFGGFSSDDSSGELDA